MINKSEALTFGLNFFKKHFTSYYQNDIINIEITGKEVIYESKR